MVPLIVARNVSHTVGTSGIKSTICATGFATPTVVLVSVIEIVPVFTDAGFPFTGVPVCVKIKFPVEPAEAV